MASLIHKLRGPSAHSRGSLAPTTASTATSPSLSTHMFLVEVIAFGEVYAVPVTKTTPITVVLRYVMEAAVSQEEAAQMGNVEATLYYKEKPLPLDTVVGKLPKRAVLHLHTSLSTTSSVVRDRRQGAVSMLPQDRQRYAQTTVTMQPVLKDGSAAREGSGSTSAGLSSDGGSPSVERNESAAGPMPGAASMYHDVGMHGCGMMMMLSPIMMPTMVPTVAGYAASAMMPTYCCMPVGPAGSGIRMLNAQGRTVSAPNLSASRRRESAVEFANSYHFLPNTTAAPAAEAAAVGGVETMSPRPSPPASHGAARRFSAPSDDHYVVVYLRLPRDRAAARLSAAAISSDSNIEMEEVEPEEVPQEEMLNATFSTVATNKSLVPRVYAYRRLRVRRDFPVGTLRELCAVAPNHRLYLTHVEISDEAKSFAELGVPANAVFYFKATLTAGSPSRKARTLTRERLQEHLEAGAAAAWEGRALDSPARSPSHIDAVQPSLDRSLPSPPVTPTLTPVASQQQRPRSSSASSVTSTQSIHERIEAFNEGVVCNPGCTEEEGDRYVVEGKELTITSAVTAEQARRAAELAARQAEAAAEEAAERQWADRPCSPNTTCHVTEQPAALPIDKEEGKDVAVDVVPDTHADPPVPTLATARGEMQAAARSVSPDPQPQTLTATAVVTPVPKHGKTLGENKVLRWMRRSSSSASSTDGQRMQQPQQQPNRGPHPTRVSRARMMYSKRMQRSTSNSAAAASEAPVAEGAKEATATRPCCTPLTQEDINKTAGATPAPVMSNDAAAPAETTAKRLSKKAKNSKRAAAPASPPPGLHSHSESAATSRHSSRSSSIATSLITSFRRLTRGKSKEREEGATSAAVASGKSKSRSSSASSATHHASKRDGRPMTPAEKSLNAMKQKSERVSRQRAKLAAAAAAAAAVTSATDGADTAAAVCDGEKEQQQQQQPVKAEKNDHDSTGNPVAVGEGASTPAAVPAKPSKARRASTGSSSASSRSYSERRRQSADAVRRQPVSFLGSDPSKPPAEHQPTPTIGAAHTLEEISATLSPAALSNTRVPTPRNSPSPVSILVSPSPEQRKRESSNGSGEATKMTEANVNDDHRRRAADSATPESRAGTPDYSVESTGSINRLRITIKDPEDPTRFHYGVPVEPDCPVGALREWITAMQPAVTEKGKTPPSLRDVDRYGVFAGDTYLRDESHVTFGDVTGGRNDVIFSIRSRI
jgi:hypothetical protein